jgi:hypothetical protein
LRKIILATKVNGSFVASKMELDTNLSQLTFPLSIGIEVRKIFHKKIVIILSKMFSFILIVS